MIAFLADENFNRNIVRGLIRRTTQVDIVVAQDEGLTRVDDHAMLEWAAQYRRVVLTHDAATMVQFGFTRLDRGLPMPGIIVVTSRLPVSQAIEELILICKCSRQEEWSGVIEYLPL